jgi:hypothetical protein
MRDEAISGITELISQAPLGEAQQWGMPNIFGYVRADAREKAGSGCCAQNQSMIRRRHAVENLRERGNLTEQGRESRPVRGLPAIDIVGDSHEHLSQNQAADDDQGKAAGNADADCDEKLPWRTVQIARMSAANT